MSVHADLVVVGVDGSDAGVAALRWADRYAGVTGSRLRIVTTWMWPASYGAPVVYDGFSFEAYAHEVIEKAQAELSLPATHVETVCRQGSAGPVLVSESDDAALLVVGSRGHGAISSVLLGSVSNHCVHHASCPVVIVR